MEKGKVKKEKKYLSIMLVPHFTGNLKVLKFSTRYSRLVGMLVVAFISMVCMCILVVYSVNQSEKLKASVMRLSELNIEQKNLINEKSSQIEDLKEKNLQAGKSIKEYVDKYQEMTDTYISSKTNRSGDRNDKTFIQDMNELRDLLNNIGQLSNVGNVSVEGLTETEGRIKEYINSIPTLWPASGRISSKFGVREDPFWFSSKFHAGIDIAANYGDNIKASANGTVIYSGYKSGYGNCIFIDHGHGLTTVYGHCSRLLAKQGQNITKGEVIAKVGSSGRSTGPHLHFEVRIDDIVVDPLRYLDSK